MNYHLRIHLECTDTCQDGLPEAITRTLSRYKVSIAGFAETRIPGSGESNLEGFTMIHSVGEDRTKVVTFLLDQNIIHILLSWCPVSSRFLLERLKHKHRHLIITVAYALTEEASNTDKDSFYSQLELLINSTPPHDQLLAMGDFNAVTGTDRTTYIGCCGRFGRGTSLYRDQS